METKKYQPETEQSKEVMTDEAVIVKLSTHFEVPDHEIKNLLRRHMGVRAKDGWIMTTNEDGTVELQRPGREQGYKIGTTPAKRYDKSSRQMVESVAVVLLERTHRPIPNVGTNAGRNETGHILPPS